MKMKALVLNGVGDLQYREVAMPSPKENEVLLKVMACGICSSDIDRIFKTGTYHFPTIPGHEFSGQIVALGDNVDSSLLHQKVSVFPLIPCGKCAACDIGEYARCENYNYFGSRCDGGFAEYLAVPVWNLVFMPKGISYEAAALCEPAAVALHAINAARILPGDTVVIVGNGTIGLLATMWANICGAENVFLVGHSDKKIEFTRDMGFSNVISSERENVSDVIYRNTGRKKADVAMEFVGNSESITTTLDVVKKGGRVVLTGNPSGDILLKRDTYWKILRGELTVRGTWNSSFNANKNEWNTVIKYIADGMLPVEKLITHRFSLAAAADAFHMLKDKTEVSIKTIFEMK